MKISKKLKGLALALAIASSLYGCFGGSGKDESSNSVQSYQQPAQVIENTQTENISENPTYQEDNKVVLYSEYGNAKLKIKNAVLIRDTTRAGTEHTTELAVPHTGTSSIQLQINDGDSDYVYVYGKIGNSNLADDSKFGINSGEEIVQVSGKDYSNDEQFTNEKMIKVSISDGTGTLNWRYTDNTGNSEGQTFEINTLRLYNLLTQGSEKVLDLGDYFSSFKIKFNALPQPQIVGTNNCPVNAVDTNNDGVADRYEIPPNYDCVSIRFNNPDNLSYNPQYSLDGTNFNDLDYDTTYDIESLGLSQGSTTTKTITVKEYLDSEQTVLDQGTKTLPTIYKDVDKVGNTDLNGTVQDYATGNTWSVGDLGTAEFADPGSNENAGVITVTGSSANYGTCNVYIRKDGTVLSNQTMPCNNINVSYTVPASDKGTGWHGIEFYIYKQYNNGSKEVGVDRFTIDYKVNESPSTP